MSQHDFDTVVSLLGRTPMGDFAIVARAADGTPRVIRNAPFMHYGTPMPTRFWLTDKRATHLIGTLEAAGGVNEAEAELDPAAVAAVHARYAAERNADIPADYAGHRPYGGVAGTRTGLKCLHAHYAYHLAGGDDLVGRWVAQRIDAQL